jgi:hypothetical protein
LGPALAAVVAALVFGRCLGDGFVWDDHRSVVANPTVAGSGPWWRPLTDGAAADPFGYFRPLRTIELRLDRALFGAEPLAFHVHSLLWHAAAAALLVLVLRRLLGDGRAALVGALLWAVHPAQVETVAWISCRGDLAMGALVLASILFALRSQGFDRDLAASLACSAIAPLYKETAVALWIVVAALRLARLARAPVWPYVAVAAAYFGYRQGVEAAPFRHTTAFVLGGSTLGTLATTVRAFGFYLCETLLPAQSLDWFLAPSRSFADGAVLAWLAAHAALVATAIAVRRRAPAVTVAVAWFYAFLLPAANWPVFVGIPTTERYLYLSLGGAALAAGCAIRRGALVPALVVLGAFAVQCVGRQAMWQSDDALWDAVRMDHESPAAYDRFAKDLRLRALSLRRDSGATDDPSRAARARELLEESLEDAHRSIALRCAFEGTDHERDPRARDAELTASNVCHLLGRDGEALFHADEAIRIDETADEFGHVDRANALLALGHPDEAVAAMRRALEIRPSRAGPDTEAFFARAEERRRRDGDAVPLDAATVACPARRAPSDAR